ncbi:hypothetical protein D9M71_784470 [compost metagenome]
MLYIFCSHDGGRVLHSIPEAIRNGKTENQISAPVKACGVVGGWAGGEGGKWSCEQFGEFLYGEVAK